MLLKEEFVANLSYLEPNINAMVFAGEDLMNNKMLREVLYMVVVAGNFLNAGGYAGNAVGVKLSSLQKLTDIRANKPGMNLIHFVALQAEKKNHELLTFPEKLVALENASKLVLIAWRSPYDMTPSLHTLSFLISTERPSNKSTTR